MFCHNCKKPSVKLKCVDTRQDINANIRWREYYCPICNYKTATVERVYNSFEKGPYTRKKDDEDE